MGGPPVSVGGRGTVKSGPAKCFYLCFFSLKKHIKNICKDKYVNIYAHIYENCACLQNDSEEPRIKTTNYRFKLRVLLQSADWLLKVELGLSLLARV